MTTPTSALPQPDSRENTIRADDAPHNPAATFLSAQPQKRYTGAMGVSIGLHALAILLIFLIVTYAPIAMPEQTTAEKLPSDIIWLDQRGPGGGIEPSLKPPPLSC